MDVTKVFRAGGVLTPDEPPFSQEPYRDPSSGRLSLYGIDSCSPQVIASPKLTGKTTQVNFIADRHSKVSREAVERIDVDISPHLIRSEDDLRARLAEDLDSTDTTTLQNILESSRRLVRGERRKLLAIINAEELPDKVLHWLLDGIKSIEEHPSVRTDLVQVLIDGSFSIQTLTTGDTSPYPMEQVYPHEFTEKAQREFVANGLGRVNVELTSDGYEALFFYTNGDKYLTQAICLNMALELGDSEARMIAGRDIVSQCVEEYINAPPYLDELRLGIAQAVSEIAASYRLTSVYELIMRIEERWENLTIPVRAELYRNGLVRRKGQSGHMLRAPIVLDIAGKSLDRLRPVRELLDRSVSLDGVVEHEEFSVIIKEIEKAATVGTLSSLHAGYGKRTASGTIEVEAMALNGGEYKGIWDLPTAEAVKVGEEVWCLLWSIDLRKGRRKGEVATFGVKEPS